MDNKKINKFENLKTISKILFWSGLTPVYLLIILILCLFLSGYESSGGGEEGYAFAYGFIALLVVFGPMFIIGTILWIFSNIQLKKLKIKNSNSL